MNTVQDKLIRAAIQYALRPDSLRMTNDTKEYLLKTINGFHLMRYETTLSQVRLAIEACLGGK